MPALNIKDAEVRQWPQELARCTGQSMTEAVKAAVREKLARERAATGRTRATERVLARARRRAQTPLRDAGAEAEIVGNGENGLPL